MRDPDGATVFVALDPPARIVFDHVSGPQFQVTAAFDDQGGGRTRVTFCMRFESAATRAQVATFAVEANEQNLDRLEAELARMP